MWIAHFFCPSRKMANIVDYFYTFLIDLLNETNFQPQYLQVLTTSYSKKYCLFLGLYYVFSFV